MMRNVLALTLGAWLGCAASESVTAPAPMPEADVPACGPLESLPALPEGCEAGELGAYSRTLSEAIGDRAISALVRVDLDDGARVRDVCVESGPGYAAGSARTALAKRLDAIRALPPGPECVAGRRIDLFRYEAKWAEFHDRDMRCTEQTRVTRDTQGPTTVRDRTVHGNYGAYDREYERCMDYQADWIVLDAPGTTRPVIFAKPEISDPPGPDAYETGTRCKRLSRVFEKRAACIEADGWERLDPPPR